eukprot:TRINITY_DN54294_c0_g1_i1.p2 TRINITY_DN54294_c0_g1~~TRINITY_DN54294_c0_g1_i1.p2  ORF type:complete len:105 (-),score=38.20 TRINITY_DN54294_c0_g1_i1:152-466(-)
MCIRDRKNTLAQQQADTLNMKLMEEMTLQQQQTCQGIKLQAELTKLQRENEVLLSEVQLLESEDTRIRKENSTLKEEVARLDKIVYGQRSKKKSAMRFQPIGSS